MGAAKMDELVGISRGDFRGENFGGVQQLREMVMFNYKKNVDLTKLMKFQWSRLTLGFW